MNANSANYKNLLGNLEDLIKVYRHLLAVVRKEKEILISASLDDLSENNRTKENMLGQVRILEQQRQNIVAELAVECGLSVEPLPRLAQFAQKLGGEPGEHLLRVQATLELLFKRVQELNQDNEVLVKSALENISGAIDSIRGTLQNKKTYQAKGTLVGTENASLGRMISKEA